MAIYKLMKPSGQRFTHEDGEPIPNTDNIDDLCHLAHAFFETGHKVSIQAKIPPKVSGDHPDYITLHFVATSGDCVASASGNWKMQRKVFVGGADIHESALGDREDLLNWMEKIANTLDKRVQSLITRRVGQ